MRWHPCHLIQLADDVEVLLNLFEEVSVFVGYKTCGRIPFFTQQAALVIVAGCIDSHSLLYQLSQPAA